MNDREFLLEKKAHIVGYFEELFSGLEITPAQLGRIRTSYEAVGTHLAQCETLKSLAPRIFVQGSVSLGTTVRPIHDDQHFDVDLVCKLEAGHPGCNQAGIHSMVGDGVKEHETYAEIIAPLKRGWRLKYAESSRFHLDITPAVPELGCPLKSIHVPDRERKRWQPSNPEGYGNRFKYYAGLKPRFTKRAILANREHAYGKVDPLPSQIGLKNILQRTVQILKRHRDIMFEKRPEQAPISIIITTLAAQAYAHVVQHTEYESEFDLLRDVIERMPNFIQRISSRDTGYYAYLIPNETVSGENFAEKWNKDSSLATDFYAWHAAALREVDSLLVLEGLENYKRVFATNFGGDATTAAFQRINNRMAAHRGTGLLSYAATPPGLNLISGSPVRPNTFFGK